MIRPSRLAIVAFLFLAGRPALAETRQEVWPGLEAYLALGPRSRVVLGTASVRGAETEVGAGRTALQDAQLFGFFDVTLKPVLRHRLGVEDASWERNRYLWGRIGYLHGTSLGDDESTVEHRGVLELTGRAPLGAGAWGVGRGRLERRDVDGELSTRYRQRLAIERETPIAGIVTVPYVNAEAFWDSRFDAWSRWLYHAGVEVELSRRWEVANSRSTNSDSAVSPGGFRRTAASRPVRPCSSAVWIS